MALSNLNPITIQNMIYNILTKAGVFGRAVRLANIVGTVVGVPQEALDVKGLRNLVNKAIVLSPDDDKPVLQIYQNHGTLSPAFKGHDHNNKGTIINSLFVLVDTGDGEKPKVCLNYVLLNAVQPTLTPTPTPTP
jgi:hypothetical protein